MRRRRFIALLGVCRCFRGRSSRGRSKGEHVPIIGYVAPTDPQIPSRSTAAFLKRLRELGWIDGRNNHNRVSLGPLGGPNDLTRLPPSPSGSTWT